MPQEPSLEGLMRPLEETRHSRESLIDALRNEAALPSVEVAMATFYVEAVEQDILDLLAKACAAELDFEDCRLLFRGLHILGGRRRPAGFPALIAFLRGPVDRVEDVFAGALFDKSVPAIVAGMFNGDVDQLLGLIMDRAVDELVRDTVMRAFIGLVIDGRIERPFAADFLRRFDDERMMPPRDVAWNTWMTAVALLRLEDLSPRVDAAFADGRMPDEFADQEDFHRLLAAALERPDDPELLDEEYIGYIEDVLDTLQRYSRIDEDDDVFALDADEPFLDGDDTDLDSPGTTWGPELTREPVRNPLRHVGRNDPCPCGSGRKFKKCCLTS